MAHTNMFVRASCMYVSMYVCIYMRTGQRLESLLTKVPKLIIISSRGTSHHIGEASQVCYRLSQRRLAIFFSPSKVSAIVHVLYNVVPYPVQRRAFLYQDTLPKP